MRAQFSADLLVTIAFALIILTVLLASFDAQFKASREQQNRLDAARVAGLVAGAGDAVLAGANGSSVNVTLPSTLATGDAYTVTLVPGVGVDAGARVDVSWDGGSVSRPFATRVVSGSASAGAVAVALNQDGRLVFS